MDLRVLIVDDSVTGRKLLKRALPLSLAATVTETGSGADAVQICTAQRIDLMFLDLTMPGVTGYDVLAALKEIPSPPIVVVVSGDVQRLGQARVKALGAFAFIGKPVTTAALEDVLKEARFL